MAIKHQFPKIAAAAAILALLAGCASQPPLQTLRNWRSDGHGKFVNKHTGQVITDAQYTELVAQEAYLRIHNMGGGDVNYCQISNK